MSTTNLTAKLKMVVQGQNKINKMVRDINRAQQSVRDAGDQAGYFARKIVQATDKVNKLSSANGQVANTAKKATAEYNKMHGVIGKIGSKLKWLASVYLGVMGIRGITTASDTITHAQNKLNSLDGGNPQQTEEAMGKMYAASQRSRTGYADMMTNVSKSMTLAGKAFDDNIDNAIKFQEIMAKSYSIGGASAAEQASSMYQLVQALGSGTLQGDELRSVREGAAVAYKEIEKFAQGIYKTEESLKDLASQGKITSDIVVAAILNADKTISDKFEDTAMTFGQAATYIKNTALYAFKPVLEMLNQALNSDFGKAVLKGISQAIQFVANVLTGVFNLVSSIYNFIVNNWNVIKYIVMAIGSALAIYVIYNLVMIINQLRLLIYGLFASLGTVIAETFAIAAQFGWKAALALLGINWAVLAVVAVLVILIAIIWAVSDNFRDACGNIMGAVFAVGAFIYNIVVAVVNFIVQTIASCGEIVLSVIEFVLNCCMGGFNSFGDGVANLIGQIIGWFLSLGKVVTTIIDAIFGTNWTAGLESLRKNVTSWGKNKKAITIDQEVNTMNRMSYGKAFGNGYDFGTKGYDWVSNKMSLPNLDTSAYGLNTTDPSTMLGDIPANLKDTAGNTGKMADAMDLAEEDLEYLRKIADMEWRKEFTTAEIKVDMSNYNTVNGDSDLDGIVTRLADKLYEELDMVANGVYA